MRGDRGGQTRGGEEEEAKEGEEETLMTTKLRALDGSEPARRGELR